MEYRKGTGPPCQARLDIRLFLGTAGTSHHDAKREDSSSQNYKIESINAWYWGGVARSSEEALVMGAERRGNVKQSEGPAQLSEAQEEVGRAEDKTFPHV